MNVIKCKGGKILWRAALFFWLVTILLPLLWIVVISLKSNQEFFQSVWALPKKFMFSNYFEAWYSLSLGRAFWNTFVYVGVSLFFKLVFTMMVSYGLTRVKFRGRKFLLWLVMLSLFLPGVNTLVPTYVLISKLHLLNSISGLIILSSVGIDAFSVMVMNGFLSTIPSELEDSAYIDGAGYFQALAKIIVPMAKPGLVTVGVFSFLGLYNNFLWPFIMLSDPKKYPIAVKMFEVNTLMQYDSNWVVLCATIVLGMLPSILFYILLQKQLQGGVTIGALKG